MHEVSLQDESPVSSLCLANWRDAADRARALIHTPQCHCVLDHWLAVGQADLPPSRRNLDPLEMRSALEHIFLIELEEGGDMRYRLAGERIQARHPGGIMGKTLADITDGEMRDKILRYCRQCMFEPAIIVVTGMIYHEWDRPGYGERLLLPLLDRITGTRGILGITVQEYEINADTVQQTRNGTRSRTIIPLDGRDMVTDDGF